MTELCFVCNTMILDHSKATVFLAYPCFLIAHNKCGIKFKSAFKDYYGFIIDTKKMTKAFNKKWNFEDTKTDGTLLDFIAITKEE